MTQISNVGSGMGPGYSSGESGVPGGWMGGSNSSSNASDSGNSGSTSIPVQDTRGPNQWGEMPNGSTGTGAPGAIDRPGEASEKLRSIGGLPVLAPPINNTPESLETPSISASLTSTTIDDPRISQFERISGQMGLMNSSAKIAQLRSMLEDPDTSYAPGQAERAIRIVQAADPSYVAPGIIYTVDNTEYLSKVASDRRAQDINRSLEPNPSLSNNPDPIPIQGIREPTWLPEGMGGTRPLPILGVSQLKTQTRHKNLPGTENLITGRAGDFLVGVSRDTTQAFERSVNYTKGQSGLIKQGIVGIGDAIISIPATVGMGAVGYEAVGRQTYKEIVTELKTGVPQNVDHPDRITFKKGVSAITKNMGTTWNEEPGRLVGMVGGSILFGGGTKPIARGIDTLGSTAKATVTKIGEIKVGKMPTGAGMLPGHMGDIGIVIPKRLSDIEKARLESSGGPQGVVYTPKVSWNKPLKSVDIPSGGTVIQVGKTSMIIMSESPVAVMTKPPGYTSSMRIPSHLKKQNAAGHQRYDVSRRGGYNTALTRIKHKSPQMTESPAVVSPVLDSQHIISPTKSFAIAGVLSKVQLPLGMQSLQRQRQDNTQIPVVRSITSQSVDIIQSQEQVQLQRQSQEQIQFQDQTQEQIQSQQQVSKQIQSQKQAPESLSVTQIRPVYAVVPELKVPKKQRIAVPLSDDNYERPSGKKKKKRSSASIVASLDSPWYPASYENVTFDEFKYPGKRATHIRDQSTSRLLFDRQAISSNTIPTFIRSKKYLRKR